MSEEYSVGYSEGYQAGWNAAMDATPPAAQRHPLTKERIGQIIEQCKITLVNYCSGEKQIEFARAIEAAHGIKETNT